MRYKWQMLFLFSVVFVGSQFVFAGQTVERKASRIIERSRPSFSLKRSVEVVRESQPVEKVEKAEAESCRNGSCRKIVRSVERTSRGRSFGLFRRWR